MAEKNYPVEVFHPVFFTPPRLADAAFMWHRPARDARSACKTAHVGTTRPTPQSKWLRRRAFLACAVVHPSILRTQAALGSGFTLQVAFWYQNAMLALFLRSKKSQKCSPILIPLRRIFCFSFCTSHKIQNFCASDAVVATLVAM